jgi:type IV fimbrial biogenesis protein FimT
LTGHSDNTGFTLVELLVVLVITIILAVTAVPSFITYLQTNRLITASQNLYYALQYARTEAVKRNATVYVSFRTGSNWCYGINATCSCNTANSCALGSTSANSSSQLTLSATGLSSNSIRFEPNHGAAGSSSTITLTNSQSIAMSVRVRLLGSLLLCSSQVSGYSACT